MGLQSGENPNFKNFGIPKALPIWESREQWHFDVGPMANHREYYKGEGGGFPQVQAVMSLVSPCMHMARSYTKVLQLCTNQLVVWFVQVHMDNWLACHSSYSLSWGSNSPFFPPKCCKLGNIPQLLFSMFSHLNSYWVFQGAWGCITIRSW
jgi:hypothetical protein